MVELVWWMILLTDYFSELQEGMLAQLAARLRNTGGGGDGGGVEGEEMEWGPVMVDDNCLVSFYLV